jgi:hypothetical protein
LDAPAQAIVAAAQSTNGTAASRAVAAVQAILTTYYSSDGSKVIEVVYTASEPGLSTTAVGTGQTTRGRIQVGDYFLNNTTAQGLARRVLQVGHEIHHIDQWRAGMVGKSRQHEREFLAFYWEALAPAVAGTGRVSHSTRVSLIDAALQHFNCFPEATQREHASKRDELVAARSTHQAASGQPATPLPTACAPDSLSMLDTGLDDVPPTAVAANTDAGGSAPGDGADQAADQADTGSPDENEDQQTA